MTNSGLDIHTIISGAGIVFMLLVGVVGWFVREKAMSNDRRLDEQEHRLHQLELAKAEMSVEMRQLLTGFTMLGEIRTEIAARYITREDWATMDGKLDALHRRIGGVRETLAHMGAPVREDGGS